MKTTCIRTFLITASLAAISATASAEVLVYKGTQTIATSQSVPVPRVILTYYVVDTASSSSQTLFVYKSGTSKIAAIGGAEDVRFTVVEKSNGKPSLILTNPQVITSQDSYTHGLLYLRGIQAPLTIQTSPQQTTGSYPRLLIGTNRKVESYLSGNIYFEVNLRLIFQPKATIDANNSGLKPMQVMEALQSSFAAKGYKAQ